MLLMRSDKVPARTRTVPVPRKAKVWVHIEENEQERQHGLVARNALASLKKQKRDACATGIGWRRSRNTCSRLE
jgi:hypothetical protein